MADGGRDVVVPLRFYKTVVVFSTLLAVVGVVAGFMVLDAATRAGRAPPAEVNAPLAVVGLGLIVAGAAVFAFGARFRAPGMGKAKTDSDEPPGDG
jgi:uncharacterized membrane protein HdeD (DUF308 family)